MRTTFTDEERAILDNWGWTFSADLVGEVAYREAYERNDRYVVIHPDGTSYQIITDKIEVALGTY